MANAPVTEEFPSVLFLFSPGETTNSSVTLTSQAKLEAKRVVERLTGVTGVFGN